MSISKFWKLLFIAALAIVGALIAGFLYLYVFSDPEEEVSLEAAVAAISTSTSVSAATATATAMDADVAADDGNAPCDVTARQGTTADAATPADDDVADDVNWYVVMELLLGSDWLHLCIFLFHVV